ncbi:hypothetical protein B0T17DRAFT_510474 [Bombardia bombarda]|uniref:Uncharacterized protein n=1 Tax=Bombardia bombarda TaxID=252184 RepID=A0AA39WIA0_9PEZI|nr:hypothetical protein B0T17DRAFT_510474 [Bombardia bombarda]
MRAAVLALFHLAAQRCGGSRGASRSNISTSTPPPCLHLHAQAVLGALDGVGGGGGGDGTRVSLLFITAKAKSGVLWPSLGSFVAATQRAFVYEYRVGIVCTLSNMDWELVGYPGSGGGPNRKQVGKVSWKRLDWLGQLEARQLGNGAAAAAAATCRKSQRVRSFENRQPQNPLLFLASPESGDLHGTI